MTASLVTSALATYGAVVSTLSFILAVKVFKAGNPRVELHWEYFVPDHNLSLIVLNVGRADVTISTIELYIVRHVVTRRSPISDAVAIRRETIDHISGGLWRDNDIAISFRLASYSEVSIPVKSEAIRLPSELPIDELLLQFVVTYPGGSQIVYMRAEHLYPSPGPLEG